MRTCDHGVEWKSTKVWNEACWRCREVRDAFDRQTSKIGGQLTKRYRAGEFDEPRPRGLPYDPDLDHYASLSDMWKARRAKGLAKWGTKAENADPAPERTIPAWVLWALSERAAKFTPAQRQALELVEVEFLSRSEAAQRAHCSYSAFRKRLKGAYRVLAILLDAEARGIPPSRVRRGANRGRAAV